MTHLPLVDKILLVTQRYRSLQDFMEQTGTTNKDLAEQLGIKPSTLSLLCSRKRQPSLPLAIKIVELTGVPYRSLLIAEDEE